MGKIEKSSMRELLERNQLQKSGEWKAKLTIKLNFMSIKDNNEKHAIYSKSDSIRIGNDTSKTIPKFFDLFLHNSQVSKKISVR